MAKNRIAIKQDWDNTANFKELEIPETVATIFFRIQTQCFLQCGNIIEATSFALAVFMNTTESFPTNKELENVK